MEAPFSAVNVTCVGLEPDTAELQLVLSTLETLAPITEKPAGTLSAT
jgi:hypothetical protein